MARENNRNSSSNSNRKGRMKMMMRRTTQGLISCFNLQNCLLLMIMMVSKSEQQ